MVKPHYLSNERDIFNKRFLMSGETWQMLEDQFPNDNK